MERVCEFCNKKYIWEENQHNWGKNGPKDGKGTVNSKRFCSYYCGTQYVVAKQKQTFLKKYGVDNPAKMLESTLKQKQTKLKKYGNETYVNPEKQKITRLNNLKENPDYYHIAQNKREITCLEKYGCKSVSQNEEIKKKQKQTCIKKYGVRSVTQLEEVKNKIKETNIKRYGGYTLQSEELNKKVMKTNLEKYGVPYGCMTPPCRKANGVQISKINLSWKSLIEQLGYEVITEKTLGLFSFDLYIPELNLVIDINPSITHQSTKIVNFNYGKINPKSYNYHIKKYQLAKDNGYNCIMIWDWDNKNKILTLLSKKEEIDLKNCEIKEIQSMEECSTFLNKYHIQNTCKHQDIRVGLYNKLNNELIIVMTFKKSRYNKKYEYELLQYASCKIVHKALSTMFNYFIDKYKPKSIIFYCDRSKFDGVLFKNINFKLIKTTKPFKHWYNRKIKQHFTDNEIRKSGACKILNIPQIKKHINENGELVDNDYIMKKENYLEIYDCGQSSYLWKKEDNNGTEK